MRSKRSKPFRFALRDKADLLLLLLQGAVEDDNYGRVLAGLGNVIRAASKRIERAQTTPSEEFVTDLECELVEGLLGAAFVVCQTKITAVTSWTLQLSDHLVSDRKLARAFVDARLVRDVSPMVRGRRLSVAESVWGLANYFKHREDKEWLNADWSKPPARIAKTIEVIRKLGLKKSSTGNLRTGAKALGVTDFSNLTILEHRLRVWGTRVLERCERSME